MLFLILPFLILMLTWFMSFNYEMYKLKVSIFESGFESSNFIQTSFSINFFFIMLIFVLFDLELILFLSFLIFFKVYMMLFILLLLFIFLTFIMEWFNNKLNWVM